MSLMQIISHFMPSSTDNDVADNNSRMKAQLRSLQEEFKSQTESLIIQSGMTRLFIAPEISDIDEMDNEKLGEAISTLEQYLEIQLDSVGMVLNEGGVLSESLVIADDDDCSVGEYDNDDNDESSGHICRFRGGKWCNNDYFKDGLISMLKGGHDDVIKYLGRGYIQILDLERFVKDVAPLYLIALLSKSECERQGFDWHFFHGKYGHSRFGPKTLIMDIFKKVSVLINEILLIDFSLTLQLLSFQYMELHGFVDYNGGLWLHDSIRGDIVDDLEDIEGVSVGYKDYLCKTKGCPNVRGRFGVCRSHMSPDERAEVNSRTRYRYKNDEIYRMTDNVRSRLHNFLKSHSIKKRGSTFEHVGMSPMELKQYLESHPNFKEGGFAWTGLDREKWHIDHIMPLNSIKAMRKNFSIDECLRRLCHWSNLQPLEAWKNGSKRAKIPNNFEWSETEGRWVWV